MFFTFKVAIQENLEQYKVIIRDRLNSNREVGSLKMKFLWKFLFIVYFGQFEKTAGNHQGKDYYVKRHIFTIAFLRQCKGINTVQGINFVNSLEYLIWFFFPFIFSIMDGNLWRSLLISLCIMLVAILFGFTADKHASKSLVQKLFNGKHGEE